MKKLLISGAMLGIVAIPSMAMAQPGPGENSGKGSITDVVRLKKEEIRDTKDKLREVAQKVATSTRKELKEERGDDKGGLRHEVAKMRAAVATKVYSATIARLETLIERIESRITKVKTEGGVTTEAEAFVATAKTNIVDAKARIAIMQSADMSTSTATTTLRANFEKVKVEAKEAKELLQSAKKNLQKAVNALARQNKGIKSNATSTPATTTPSTN